ncbi:hypothetical protein [Pseudomonas sp. LB3P31]
MANYFSGTVKTVKSQLTITNEQAARVLAIGRNYGANGSPIIFKILQNDTKLLVSFDGEFYPKQSTSQEVANELGPYIQAADIVWDE